MVLKEQDRRVGRAVRGPDQELRGLSGKRFLGGVVKSWSVCGAEWVCQAEVLKITEFL